MEQALILDRQPHAEVGTGLCLQSVNKPKSSACDLEADTHLSHEWGIRLPDTVKIWHTGKPDAPKD